jgi:hypothetical protein
MQPNPLTFAAIPVQGTGGTVSTSVALVSGMNDRVRISAVGPAPFALRAGIPGSSTCSSNTSLHLSTPVGDGTHTITALIGTKGQPTTTNVRLCLTGLAANPVFGGQRIWTVALEDPETNARLQERDIIVSTVARDPNPSFGRHVINGNAPAVAFNDPVRTRNPSPNNITEVTHTTRLTDFNVPLRLEVVGPQAAQIRAFSSHIRHVGSTSYSNTCNNTNFVDQSAPFLLQNPTLTLGTTRTDAGSNTFWICVNTRAPSAFGATETYTLRAVDPETGETVLDTTFQTIGPTRDVVPSITGGSGHSTFRLLNLSNQTPNNTLTPNVLTTFSEFNAPIAFRLTGPSHASVTARIVGGSSSCGSTALTTLIAANGQVVTSPPLGQTGVVQSLRVCISQVKLDPVNNAENLFQIDILDPQTGAAVANVVGRASTRP